MIAVVLRCSRVRKKQAGDLFSLILGAFLILQILAAVNAEDGIMEYNFKEGSPTITVYWKLSFPAECHPAETINYSIFLHLESSIQMKFYLLIEAAIDQQWVSIYDKTLLEGNYSGGQDFNWQVTITVPENANGSLRLFASTLYSSWGWLNLTNVRSLTYSELRETYSQLNQTCTELNQSYTTLNSKYNNLLSTYEPFGELANTRNLTLLFMGLATFFAATTIYGHVRRKDFL